MNSPRFTVAVALAGLLLAAPASAHRRSPGTTGDPAADATDLYAWVQGLNLVIVADFIGLEAPESGPNWARFDENVLYEIHLARGGTSLADALTWQFSFTSTAPVRADPAANPPLQLPNTHGIEVLGQLAQGNAFQQTYTVTQLTNGGSPTVVAQGVNVPPPNVGPRTSQLVYGIAGSATYESTYGDVGNSAGTVGQLQGGGRVFAGPRDDPFFEDEGAIDDLLQFRPLANPAEAARNSYAYTNVHAIVLEIPLVVANGGTAPTATTGIAAQTLGLWASASRRAATVHRREGADLALGPWRQVSRVGLPYFGTWIIGTQDRDAWSRSAPKDELALSAPYLLNPVLVRDADAVGYYGAGGPLAACASGGGHGPQTNRQDILAVYNLGNAGLQTIGDVLRVDLGTSTSGFPNGRLLTDKVADVTAGMILCSASLISAFNGGSGAQQNEPEATLPKTSGGLPAFPYLQPPWDGRSANPRPAPSLP